MDVMISIPQSSTLAIAVSGEVTRFDRAGRRYVACMFVSKARDWKTELRMPLIQYATATKLNLYADDVSVGTYCLETSTYEEIHYVDEEIETARRELSELTRIVGESLR